MKSYKLEVNLTSATSPLFREPSDHVITGRVTVPNRVTFDDVLKVLKGLHPEAKAWSVAEEE